jgi:putative redox protein
MKVNLKSTDNTVHYTATNEKGQAVNISGDGSVASPMHLVLMAVAGCSSIDIDLILKRMRQPLEGIEVQVEAKRRDETPRTFTDIHLHYILSGELKEIKVQQAIDLSLEKYCSVSLMIANSVNITSSFKITAA